MEEVADMGEVDDIHPKDETSKKDVLVNGELDETEKTNESETAENDEEEEEDKVEEEDKEVEEEDKVSETNEVADEVMEVDEEQAESEPEIATEQKEASEKAESADEENESQTTEKEDDEIHNIESDDDDEDAARNESGDNNDDDVEENDDVLELSSDVQDAVNDSDEVMIVEDANDANHDVHDADDDDDEEDDKNVNLKANGTATPDKIDKGAADNDCAVIEVSSTKSPQKESSSSSGTKNNNKCNSKKIVNESPQPRRSSRHLNRKKYSNEEKEASAESDIEEVLPEDPLAVTTDTQPPPAKSKKTSKSSKSSTIVVNDTKRLVEIASKSNSTSPGKKEPTLVIIDTKSILSGRGPVAIGQKSSPTVAVANSFPMLPMALPAQGMYPANMRATITPIPINSQANKQQQQAAANMQHAAANMQQAPILPSLTDDMFVVEAPSFIVPYVYEKPPVNDFKVYVTEMADAIKALCKEEQQKNNEAADEDDKSEPDVEEVEATKKDDDDKTKRTTYFDSPIGKFFVDIGYNLVQEFVQTDLLKQQKRKREREGGQNSITNKTIQSLIKSLEYTKENNEPYKMQLKKCEFCNYKTDSTLAMAFHLETPHMKNFVYRCNFCTYEVRSPHDILFHMEAEHCVRGRLERAPAFHQCPNCPFEDNQKGKLTRHSVACARKFKPERNMEPPLDWEPPAKIPRQPRMKQPNLTATAAMYQAMAKSSQYMKMQQAMSATVANRGRGRPSLNMSSKNKSTKSDNKGQLLKQHVLGGGSVLLPTNYQLSGNQLYQVIGGQELGSRIAGPIGLIPTMSSTASTISIQNSTTKQKSAHQPSISITPLPRGSSSGGGGHAAHGSPGGGGNIGGLKPGDSNSKNAFVMCEICDGYIKDLEQLRNHMQWIHKVKIHPKMIYNRPPLNCQKCQFRFFTDQGLERHLLGSHGLVTSSMQEAANKCKDSGRCPVCGRSYQWKLLNHVARDHKMTLKPAHLSYKCTVCTATFGMYKQFENHVYSAHSVVAKRSVDKKSSSSSSNNSSSTKSGESLLKPLKINDEITIIPQMPKSNGAGSSKDHSRPGTSRVGDTSIIRAEPQTRRKTTALVGDK